MGFYRRQNEMLDNYYRNGVKVGFAFGVLLSVFVAIVFLIAN